MNKLHGSILAISVTAGAVIAITSLSTGSGITANAQGVTASVDTASAVAGAGWADSVTITVDEAANTFRFQSNGIPSHGFADQYLIPNDVASQPFSDNTADQFTVVNSAEYFTVTEVDTLSPPSPLMLKKQHKRR